MTFDTPFLCSAQSNTLRIFCTRPHRKARENEMGCSNDDVMEVCEFI